MIFLIFSLTAHPPHPQLNQPGRVLSMDMHINCLHLYLLHSCREVPVCFGKAADSISNRIFICISDGHRCISTLLTFASPLSLKVNCTQCRGQWPTQTCSAGTAAALSCGNRICAWQWGTRTSHQPSISDRMGRTEGGQLKNQAFHLGDSCRSGLTKKPPMTELKVRTGGITTDSRPFAPADYALADT